MPLVEKDGGDVGRRIVCGQCPRRRGRWGKRAAPSRLQEETPVGMRRTNGHRATFTRVKIKDIVL